MFLSSMARWMSRPPLDALYRAEWGRIVATLIRLFGDFDVAEEAAQEAFAAAVVQWPAGGPRVPARVDHPDRTPQSARPRSSSGPAGRKLGELHRLAAAASIEEPDYDTDQIPDDRLRLIFTCCHPALAPDAQVALTLRTLCGLETDEIARAFLVPVATMAQRLVRAKRKISTAAFRTSCRIRRHAGASRRGADGRSTSCSTKATRRRGAALVRADLCAEAIRLGRVIRELMAPRPAGEVTGLLALMLLHDARREARLDERAISCSSTIRIADAGTTRRFATRRRSWTRRCAAGAGPVRAPGGDLVRSLSSSQGRGHRLAADSAPVRFARARAAIAGRVAESRRRRRDGARPATGPGAHRCARLNRRPRSPSPAPRRARRSAAPPRPVESARSYSARSPWSATTANAGFSSGVCAKWSPARRSRRGVQVDEAQVQDSGRRAEAVQSRFAGAVARGPGGGRRGSDGRRSAFVLVRGAGPAVVPGPRAPSPNAAAPAGAFAPKQIANPRGAPGPTPAGMVCKEPQQRLLMGAPSRAKHCARCRASRVTRCRFIASTSTGSGWTRPS